MKTFWMNKKKKGKKQYQLKNLKLQIPHSGVEVRAQAFIAWKGSQIVDVVVAESPEMAKKSGWEKFKVEKK